MVRVGLFYATGEFSPWQVIVVYLVYTHKIMSLDSFHLTKISTPVKRLQLLAIQRYPALCHFMVLRSFAVQVPQPGLPFLPPGRSACR